MIFSIRKTPVAIIALTISICTLSSSVHAQCDPELIRSVPGQFNAEYSGSAVALSEEFAAIGSPNASADQFTGSGVVHVYKFVDGRWDFFQTLKAPVETSVASFGSSVGVSGDVIVVGADLDTNGSVRSGASYIYRFDGIAWGLETSLLPLEGGDYDRFGFTVSVADDVVVVGSPNSSEKSGSVHVYRYDRAQFSWNHEATLAATNAGAYPLFGYSVAVSGTSIIASAPLAIDTNDFTISGMIFVFDHDGQNWDSGEQLLRPSSNPELFGTSVDIENDLVVIGSSYFDGPDGQDQGIVHVYRRNDSDWNLEKELFATDSGSKSYFGACVSVSGNMIVSGSPNADTPVASAAGSVSTFRFDENDWVPAPPIFRTSGATNDFFGDAVATHAGAAAFGAWGSESADGTLFDVGDTQFYQLEGSRWVLNPAFYQSSVDERRFGTSVEVRGDVAIVGAPWTFELNNNITGRAVIFERDAGQWDTGIEIQGGETVGGDGFGFDVALGNNRAVISAPGENQNRGGVYIFEPNKAGVWMRTARLTASDRNTGVNNGENDQFGYSVAISGDIVVVSARLDSDRGTNSGSVYFFDYNGQNWTQRTNKKIPPVNSDGRQFGFSVALSGTTVAVGSLQGHPVSIFEISTKGQDVIDQPSILPLEADTGFGGAVYFDNDVLAIGDSKDNNSIGALYIYRKNINGELEQEQKILGAPTGRGFGHMISVDGDKLVVESGFRDVQESATVFAYKDGQWEGEWEIQSTSPDVDGRFGQAVSISGNTVLVGAKREDVGSHPNAGNMYFFDFDDCAPPETEARFVKCIADITSDGVLDFFDVSAFLKAFNQLDPVADISGDGRIDFFDVSAFLTAFGQGCP